MMMMITHDEIDLRRRRRVRLLGHFLRCYVIRHQLSTRLGRMLLLLLLCLLLADDGAVKNGTGSGHDDARRFGISGGQVVTRSTPSVRMHHQVRRRGRRRMGGGASSVRKMIGRQR